MKKFISEFKEFALKGNVLDMAIGVIIGGAFGKIVTSLVESIISPLLALLTNGATLDSLTITLREAVGENPAVELGIGAFLQAIIDFLIIALCLFLVLKAIMTAKAKFEAMRKKEEEEAAEEAAEDTELSVLLEIKELLQKK